MCQHRRLSCAIYDLKSTYPSLLQAVTDQDLTSRLLVLLSQRVQRGVVGLLVADKGAVSLNDNVVGLTVLDSYTLLVPGVQLEGILAFYEPIVCLRFNIPQSG